ncbi:unnamed protein product, partial [Auanema sp. JU1783]
PQKTDEEQDITEKAKSFGDKITGLFKKGPAHLDYPTSESYDGPLSSTDRASEVHGDPLTHHVAVYHSGKSDEQSASIQPEKPEEELDITEKAKSIGDKITGLFKRGPAHVDYPVSDAYDGPLSSMDRASEVHGDPLTHHVAVYHSGKSDERPTTSQPQKPEEEQDITEKAKSLGDKITGLFKKGPA